MAARCCRSWVALPCLLALCAGRASGFEKIANFTDGVRMHFADRRCNSLKYHGWGYIVGGSDPTGFQDIEILKAMEGSVENRGARRQPPSSVDDNDDDDDDDDRDPDEDSVSFSTSLLAARPTGLVWLSAGDREDDGLTDLWLSELTDFHHMFLDSSELNSIYDGAWYSLSTFQTWTLYRTVWAATHSIFLRSVRRAADLHADARRVIFTQEPVEPDSVYIRELSAYDIHRKVRIPLEFPEPCDGGSSMLVAPALASEYILAQVWFNVTRQSEIFVFDLVLNDRSQIGHADDALLMAARMWDTHRTVARDLAEPATLDGTTVVAWIELPNDGTAALKLLRRPNTNAYAVWAAAPEMTQNATIFLRYLPTREACRIAPRAWQDRAAGYTQIKGFAGGGPYLFLVLTNPGETRWIIAAAPVMSSDDDDIVCPTAQDFIYIEQTASVEPVRIISASYESVLVQWGVSNVYWNVKMYELKRPIQDVATGKEVTVGALVCRTFDDDLQEEVTGASIYDDVLFYRVAEDGASHLYYSDFDKDNDRVWDAVDRFPLAVQFANDTDNDGIGDESDIVYREAACEDELLTNPGSCTDDFTVLYSAWAVSTFFLVLFLSIYGYRQSSERDRLYLQRKDTTDAWVNREWRMSNSDVSDNQLHKELVDLDRQIKAYLESRDMWVVQALLFALTILTVLIWVAMSWEPGGLDQKTENILVWVDFFSATIFLIDLVYRWVFRHPGEYTGALDYVQQNWYDFPSLITDIPGFTTAGALNVFAVARLVRMLRTFKMFRVIRLYHGVTRQEVVLSLILKHELVWQGMFCAALIVVIGIIIKLVEDDYQEDFESFWNVLWFCLVTVTTVGYGDMYPVNWASRVMAMVLMLSGIGLIGVLTAKMGEHVRNSGVDDSLLRRQWERMNRGKWLLSMEVLRTGTLYNPLINVFKPFEQCLCSAASCHEETRLQRQSTGLISLSFILQGSSVQYRFHSDCFVCKACGAGVGSGEDGICFVVKKQRGLSIRRGSKKRNSRAPKSREETDEHVCEHSVYLHRACVRQARGVGTVSKLSINKLSVEGCKGAQRAIINGEYVRQAQVNNALASTKTITFTHRNGVVAIRAEFVVRCEPEMWQLVLIERGQVLMESPTLVGSWTDPQTGGTRFQVNDNGVIAAWWSIVHDPLLDVPVRKLITYYASARTRAVFDDLLKTQRGALGGPGSFGKFAATRSRGELKGMEQQMARLACQIRAVREMDHRRVSLKVPCDHVDRLNVILMTHIKDPSVVKNYRLLIDQLEYIIFKKQDTHPCSTTLAKAFSLAKTLELSRRDKTTTAHSEVSDWGMWDDDEYDWTDSIETMLGEVDKALMDHEVHLLDNFSAIRIELEHLAYSYERVVMCQWAWEHLTWTQWQTGGKLPERQKRLPAEMPDLPPDRNQYSQVDGIVLDPLSYRLEQHQLQNGVGRARDDTWQTDNFVRGRRELGARRGSPFAGSPLRVVRPKVGRQALPVEAT